MKNTLETRLGMFVALAIIAAFVILEIVGGADFFKPGYHVRARFNNIQELKVGDRVKMAGVPIGRVEKIGLADENKVEVIAAPEQGHARPHRQQGHHQIRRPDGPELCLHRFRHARRAAAGGQPIDRHHRAAGLERAHGQAGRAASGVQNLTKSFTGDKIDNLLGPFTDFMKQNNPRITAIIANVAGHLHPDSARQGHRRQAHL